MSVTTATTKGKGKDKDRKPGTTNASSLETGESNKKSKQLSESRKKMPNPHCMLSEQTSTFLELHSGCVSVLSDRDHKLLIGILEGNMEHTSNLDNLYTYFEDDGMFVLFSLLVGVNNEFFSKNVSKSVLPDQMADVFPPLLTRHALQQEFHQIRNRWKLLDKISESVSLQSAGSDIFVNRLMNAVAVKIRESLFKRLMNVGMIFTEKPDRLLTVSHESSPEGLDPFDASFCLPLIDKNDFAAISRLVEDNLIAVLNAVRYDPKCSEYYLQYHLADYDLFRKQELGKVNEASERATLLGVCSMGNSEVRKFAEIRLFLKAMHILRTNGTEGRTETQLTLCERACSFFSVIKKLDPSQVLQVISKWQLPPDFLMTSYEALVEHAYRKITACQFLKQANHGFLPDYFIAWGATIDWLRWMTERALTEFGVQIVEASFFDKAVTVLATLDCSETLSKVIKEFGDSFSILRAKEYARQFVCELGVSASVLTTLLEKFPWLLNTWIGPSCNTLLGLCVMHSYPHLKLLLGMPLVKRHIDVESKDGLTPLMLAADYPSKFRLMADLIQLGSANVYYINRHRESVLHRMAASNNIFARSCIEFFVGSPIVELRRKGDAATALMIALSRENVDVAELLISDAGAKAATLFGRSASLRTVDVMLLRRKSLSLALLTDLGIEPDVRLIADSFIHGSLLKEECFVSMTGLEDNSRACNEVCRGNLTVTLESQVLGEDGMGVCIISQKKASDVHHKSDRLNDIGWTLLNDSQGFNNAEWVTHLRNNKREELDASVKQATKSYETNDCPICLGEFNAADCSSADMKRGKTKCGHYFHDGCWSGLKDKNCCPICRASTTFTVVRSNLFDPDPAVILQREPEGQRSYNVIQCAVAAAPLTSSKEPGVDVEGYRHPDWDVGRYEFLVDGVWVDESSPLNFLDEGKQGIALSFSSEQENCTDCMLSLS